VHGLPHALSISTRDANRSKEKKKEEAPFAPSSSNVLSAPRDESQAEEKRKEKKENPFRGGGPGHGVAY